MEQEEYTKEEINWSYIEFIDNQDILDLIEKVVLLLLPISLSILVFDCYLLTTGVVIFLPNYKQ